MRIRSITCFCNPLDSDFPATIGLLSRMTRALCQRLIKEGWQVQTARLATIPFWQFTEGADALAIIKDLEKISQDAGFDYLSIGHARLSNPMSIEMIPEILGSTSRVFCSAFLAHAHRGVYTAAVRACARVIHANARLEPEGFSNLRFCAMCGVRPFTPFFPAAYSYGRTPAFALAVECADAAVTAFTNSESIHEGRVRLLDTLNASGENLSACARLLSMEYHVPFIGIDFSLAPFPEDWCSIGRALENLGVPQIGYMGSLSGAAILAESLERGTWPRAGFNGLMLPVLEDSVLAKRSASGFFTIKDLLMISAVCGTGLDTIPLPGETRVEQLQALLLDIVSLSLRLDKPLTARLMPIPGLQAGEETRFEFEYFRNSRTMDLYAEPISGPLANSTLIEIRNFGTLS